MICSTAISRLFGSSIVAPHFSTRMDSDIQRRILLSYQTSAAAASSGTSDQPRLQRLSTGSGSHLTSPPTTAGRRSFLLETPEGNEPKDDKAEAIKQRGRGRGRRRSLVVKWNQWLATGRSFVPQRQLCDFHCRFRTGRMYTP